MRQIVLTNSALSYSYTFGFHDQVDIVVLVTRAQRSTKDGSKERFIRPYLFIKRSYNEADI